MSTAATFHVETTRFIVPTWIFTGLATGLAFGRFTTRRWLTKENYLGWDDIVLAIALVLCVAGSALLTATDIAGTKITLENAPSTLPKAFVLLLATNSTYALSIPLSKISISIFLVRVFEPSPWTRRTLYIGCTFVFIFGIIEVLINWLRCNPPAADWNPYAHPNAKCFDAVIPDDVGMALGAISGFQDFALALYPAFRIKSLQMPRKRKVQLSFLLGLGWIAGAIAIVKTYEIGYVAFHDPHNPSGSFNGALFTGFLCCIEIALIVAAASIPTFLPLLRWAWQQSVTYWTMLSSVRSGSTTGTGSSVSMDNTSTEEQEYTGQEKSDPSIDFYEP